MEWCAPGQMLGWLGACARRLSGQASVLMIVKVEMWAEPRSCFLYSAIFPVYIDMIRRFSSKSFWRSVVWLKGGPYELVYYWGYLSNRSCGLTCHLAAQPQAVSLSVLWL